MQMSSAFPPMSYKFHITWNIFSYSPAALTANSELQIAFHEFEENITWPGPELPASQKQTSYRENMKSQFNACGCRVEVVFTLEAR